MSDLYCIVGNPVAHSKSPLIHTEFSRQTGEEMRYEAIPVPQDGFAATVESFRQQGGKGMNVTVPFKIEACHISNHLTERADAAQAVNTLTFSNSEIFGDNTDGAGLVRDIVVNMEFSLRAKRILVMGAGGAARGVVLPLLKHEPQMLMIANRTRQKGEELQRRFSCYGNVLSGDYADLHGEQFDLVINATSASMEGAVPLLPPGIFLSNAMAYDMMYGIKDNPFLQSAGYMGASRLADGIGMLVEQAAESFFVWRGIRPKTAPAIDMLRSYAR